MHQSSVPKAANLDILTETVTDTGATPQMCSLFAELDKAVSEATEIIGSATADEALAASGGVALRSLTLQGFLKGGVPGLNSASIF